MTATPRHAIAARLKATFSTKAGVYRLCVSILSVAAIAYGLTYAFVTSPAGITSVYSTLSNDSGTYVNGTITKLTGTGLYGNDSADVRITNGPDRGSTENLPLYGSVLNDQPYNTYRVGNTLLLYKESGTAHYSVVDHYRIRGLVVIAAVLVVLVLAVGLWRGVTALIGLALSIAVVVTFILPFILSGHDAFLVCVGGSFIIAIVSIGIAHGLNRRTAVALIGTIVTLLLTVGITYAGQYLTMLNGSAGLSEGSNVLYAGKHISLAGILYGGIIIASLGVLNDVTTGQSAAVDELHRANRRLSRRALFAGAMSMGREHIAALINTLGIVYLAIALPTIVVTAIYNHASLLVIVNSEDIMEEIVRSLVLSISLLLAVPLTTTIAVYMIPYWVKNKKKYVKRFFKVLRRIKTFSF